MYSYRQKGAVVVLAGLQMAGLGGVLAGVQGACAGGGLPGPWQNIAWASLMLPWMCGIGVEALWWSVAGVSSPKRGARPHVRIAVARSALAGLLPGGLWWSSGQSWGLALGDWGAGWGLLVAILCVLHLGLPPAISWVFFSGAHRQRAVLVGTPAQAASFQSVLLEKREFGIEPVGWIESASEESVDAPSPEETDQATMFAPRHGIPRWGGSAEIETLLQSQRVHQVILAGGSPSGPSPQDLASTCERLGVRFTLAQQWKSPLSKRLEWESAGGWSLAPLYREPLQSPFNRLLKRGIDLVVAIPALLFGVLPLALLTWLMQRRQSPGPLFCPQWRHGREHQAFRMWKFRTMHPHAGRMDQQAQRGDLRVFPFGRFLRAHSLDEMPQFWNVLIGEMSVVGPRPHLVEHTERFSSESRYPVRAFVKPGITGLAQVQGYRGELRRPEDLQNRVEWDVRYVERWSFGLELSILWRTVWQVLFPPESAY